MSSAPTSSEPASSAAKASTAASDLTARGGAAAADLPRITLKPRKALPFFSGHPWVFASAIAQVSGSPQPADEILLCSHEGEPIARGLYNPYSNIRVRLYGGSGDRPLDQQFWSDRLDEALALRQGMLGPLTNRTAQRLVFSEADHLSGLIVDWYAGHVVLQFNSLAMAARRRLFAELFDEKLRPLGIWARFDKELRSTEGLIHAESQLGGAEQFADGPLRAGDSSLVFIEENGVRFGVSLCQGHKTGFYLDQRDNRAAAARYMASRRVLDVFCYTGGFGLAAVVQGKAHDVLGIDSSAGALVAAKANAELNGVGERLRYEKSAAFPALERLRKEGARFDAVVLDPPKLAKSRSGLGNALRAYHSLNRLAVELLSPDGFLATCSCSGYVTRDMFEEMLSSVAAATGRRIQILEARGQAPDHPVSVQCLESNYLKCYLCRVV